MDAVILGKSYPMAYTVLAQDMIAKRYGSLEAVEQTVSAGGAAAQVENIVIMAHAMMVAAVQRERVMAKIIGIECDLPDPPTVEEMEAVLLASDLSELAKAVTETIKEGAAVTVEVQEKKEKAAR